MRDKIQIILVLLCMLSATTYGQATDDLLMYSVEAGATVGGGNSGYAPLWFTANRNGLSTTAPNSAYLRAGLTFNKALKHHWNIRAGLDLATAASYTAPFYVQQAYADISWRFLNLSIGSKERVAEGKNPRLSSGGMVEGNNARPVPQVRAEIADYVNVPLTNRWLGVKGYVAYGRFTDDSWQRDFAAAGRRYVDNVLYHSKEIMLRVGKKEKFPWEFELGILMAAQFSGDMYEYDANRVSHLKQSLPHGLKDFFKVFFPTSGGSDAPIGDQVNVYGNHVGSWNSALSYYLNEWKFRLYYEHYFDDHSQMLMEYGRWKDGHIGFEVTFPSNPWISSFVWEGLATKDQTGPMLYDGYLGLFREYQVSANDDYYNNYYYQSWQHWGMGMGNPLLPGPIYNKNGHLKFRSNRVLAHHVGISGNPANEWEYRVLLSYARHWGTYDMPTDEIEHQFSSLYEATYKPRKLAGWNFTLALGLDLGDHLGNSTGGMLTIRKTGGILK